MQNFTDDNNPTINIYICSAPQNPYIYSNINYQPIIMPNSSNPNFPIYQMPMIQQTQPQIYQQPNFFSFPPNVPPFAFNGGQYLRQEQKQEDTKKKSNHHKKSHKSNKSHKSHKSSKSKKDSTKKKGIPFPHTEGSDLRGIIHYLTTKSPGNICDNGIIDIIASSNQPPVVSKPMRAKFLVDYDDLSNSSMWSPDNETNANLIFDFKTRKVKLTDYTFHTPTDETGEYPRSWRVECSNNLSNWQTVDTRFDESVMDGFDVCHCFKCQDQKDEFFRFIKITSTAATWHNPSRHYFDIAAIEFFGFLDE